MKTILFAILTFITLVNCDNKNNKKINNTDIPSLVSDNGENHKIDTLDNLNKSICNFSNPDTSLSGIILRNQASALKIIGANNNIDSFSQYRFYSKDKKETLTLTQHPGDENNQISIFKVDLAFNAKEGYKKLNIDSFQSEKGIRLGITKSELTSLLGDCYTTIDVTKNEIELHYIIEQPNDNKTKFLAKNNMPIYFANYKFSNEKLLSMEFGFENP